MAYQDFQGINNFQVLIGNGLNLGHWSSGSTVCT